MTSAPDATEPRTVMSPRSNTTDWPERTGWSISSVLTSRRAGREQVSAGWRAVDGLCASGRLDLAAGLGGNRQRPAPGLDPRPGRVRAFGADDADAALFQQLKELRDALLLARDGAEIDHDRARIEEIRRSFHLRIQCAQPFVQRHFGRQDQGHDGAATQANQRFCLGCCHSPDLSVDWRTVNENPVALHKIMWITVRTDR